MFSGVCFVVFHMQAIPFALSASLLSFVFVALFAVIGMQVTGHSVEELISSSRCGCTGDGMMLKFYVLYNLHLCSFMAVIIKMLWIIIAFRKSRASILTIFGVLSSLFIL